MGCDVKLARRGQIQGNGFLTSYLYFICLKLAFENTLYPTLSGTLAPSTLLSRTKENLRKYQSVLETSQDSGCLCCLLWGEKTTPSQHKMPRVEDLTSSAFPASVVFLPQSPECWDQPQGPLSVAFVCSLIPVRTGSSE